MSKPTYYIQPDKITGAKATLTGEELHHARKVLRTKPGDQALIMDGHGMLYEAAFKSISRHEAVLEISSSRKEVRPAMQLTMGMGIVAGERLEWAVQKATELGATDIVPLITERTEVKVNVPWKRIPRLTRIGIAACKQSGRARIPLFHEPVAINDIDPGRYGACVVFWEGSDARPLDEALAHIKQPGTCFALIGPVGGLTEMEAHGLRDKGAVLASLGPRILRTETAVVAAAALLQHRWGDMG
jgi:16S rRNA (uracil1498-N3)-methyltransferase